MKPTHLLLLTGISLLTISFCPTTLSAQAITTDQWEYIMVDSSRAKWGDDKEPEWLRYFGLDMQDVNHDGYQDILSGRYVYLNPGSTMEGIWPRVDLGFNVDGILFTNVDDDEFADLIALALPDVYWLEASNQEATVWSATRVSNAVPATGHINAQGYLTADVLKGGKEEILFSAKDGIFMAEIPDDPITGHWEFIKVGRSDGEEGFDVADIDGDGDLDIVAPINDAEDEAREPRYLHWFENPGRLGTHWNDYQIARTTHAIDRVRVEDFNADGIYDIAVTEERYPGPDPDASLYVFIGNKKGGTISWEKQVLITQYSMNNLDAADVDRDGDIDLVTNEHKGKEFKTQLFINDGKANFTEQLVDTGKECHLGTLFSDLDKDGDLDIVGHAWDNYSFMHLWRNDAITEKSRPTIGGVEFTQYTIVPEGEANKWWARSHADINKDGLLDFFVVDNNAQGGALLWYETVPGFGTSRKHVIAATSPDGKTFAGGDLASGDIDNDGDIDVLGPVSLGEWVDAGAKTELYWYENPGWKAHKIGDFPSFIKDFDLIDLNGDGKLDIAATAHTDRKMFVYRQDDPQSWTRVAEVYVDHLHEGQHVGDVDGDGDIDVVSTGFCFFNPGGDMTGIWSVKNIDPYWNSDNAYSWQYNATKIFCADIDQDNRDEVFISCSERYRTRVAWYDLAPNRTDQWIRHEIGENAYAHTLQVGDMDNDGDLDVISGNNGDQDDPDYSPVKLFLQETGGQWPQHLLTLKGAYNSYIGDVDGDGDLDFFRYDGHEGTSYELWLNNTIK